MLNDDDDAFFNEDDGAAPEVGTAAAAAAPPSVTALCGLEVTKAGLAGVDKQRADRIIEEISKGSAFYLDQQRRSARVEARLAEMRAKWDRVLKDRQLLNATLAQIDTELEELELQRDLDRVVIHIDMDAFFAAVEIRDNSKLADVPMAVGSLGMLSTSNYAARKFGVRSAMPGYIAKKLCPELVIVPCNFEKYQAVGAEIRKVFAEYDPHFRSMSCDEACMDCTEHVRRRAADGAPVTPAALAEEIRRRVFELTTLTASAGVAVNRMLAKMCTDLNKPNGQFVLPPTREAILAFLDGSPVRKIPGIGKVSDTLLRGLGIVTAKDLHEHRAALFHVMGPKSFQYALHASRGLLSGDWGTEEGHHRKSVSAERTFGRLHSTAELWAVCEKLSAAVAKELEEEGLQGRTVTVKMKRTSFEVRQRSVTLAGPTADFGAIHAAAVRILRQERTPLDLRLLGVRVSGFDHQEGGAHTLLALFPKVPQGPKEVAADSSTSAVEVLRAETQHPCNATLLVEKMDCGDGCEAAVAEPEREPTTEGHGAGAQSAPSPSGAAGDAHAPTGVPASPSPPESEEVQDPLLTQPCPVCGTVWAKTAGQWQVHVDNCLSNQPHPAPAPRKRPPPPAGPPSSGGKRRMGPPSSVTMRHFLAAPAATSDS